MSSHHTSHGMSAVRSPRYPAEFASAVALPVLDILYLIPPPSSLVTRAVESTKHFSLEPIQIDVGRLPKTRCGG
ncbi:predicted protein [Sclerotinia sclerotiorum 1980 UF-70]|uniref:Uncharacterized protein n=1 Tax=Sclerotinia sclerotiorum (strain ATCC 18683 / 1980 / Ss-1) TaxID=665079 RepID=A7E539_SCLS1|nr:predicted protein [Sclerotinia sclerotiorum 1980 UF-70]EDN91011.1 predicted protein [Sclerotinia sclerotiorum 1980 UF-70]